jgi:hypothetical protein
VTKYLKALSIGVEAFKIIKENGLIGYVSEVFDRTFHVKTLFDEIITIAREDVFNGPINIITDASRNNVISKLNVKIGDEVNRIDDTIWIKDKLAITVHDAKLWTAKRRNLRFVFNIENLNRNLQLVKHLIAVEGQQKGLGQLVECADKLVLGEHIRSQNLNYVAKAAMPRINKFINSVKRKNPQDIASSASDLAGLGFGLTPSTDDFIVGFMASLFLSDSSVLDRKNTTEINSIIEVATEGRTTTLSQEFIKNAAVGEVAEPVSDLIEVLLVGLSDDVALKTRQAISIGETSGNDTILGILIGLYLRLLNTEDSFRKRRAL